MTSELPSGFEGFVKNAESILQESQKRVVVATTGQLQNLGRMLSMFQADGNTKDGLLTRIITAIPEELKKQGVTDGDRNLPSNIEISYRDLLLLEAAFSDLSSGDELTNILSLERHETMEDDLFRWQLMGDFVDLVRSYILAGEETKGAVG